ncbi:hypothetical protein MS2017_1358 [Bathymodiolus thermophilus thioautotrophic gill symbiont]|uniref:Uncharacterized protein n=1 Tax=Bathymodiolus thermophilus thioautotrophic gill symbiont TaxID=2360 RepID=A0A3G3IMF3_9GAMM|nr:hypothetical protein [Bathymodiolus thermophilus thioautotrophic gill symbiont]AYQ57046.1 hypothetical protein MS2017_1358 [Bathymodiolus thermophilus thioautotrophic gill symbiont]
MDNNLKDLLKKNVIHYTLVPSVLVANDSGEIIALEDYYPNNNDGELNLSIALSIGSNGLNHKCWISTKIDNTTDSSKPKYHSSYNEFEHNGVTYHPYSINTSLYSVLDILNLCDGLYRFVKEENHTR